MLLLWLRDRHGRSHNNAADCCVRSDSERVDGFESRLSKAGGRARKFWSKGSCLIMGVLELWKTLSDGEAGLGASLTEPCDSTSDGAGVDAHSLLRSLAFTQDIM